MSEWEVRAVADMPPAKYLTSPRGLSGAVRALDGEDALFVAPREGESLEHLRTRLSGLLQASTRFTNVHLRIDREANGYWVYKSVES